MLQEKLIPFVGKLAEESGKIIRPYFASPSLKVEEKADETPVTLADRRAEEAMRRLIEKEYPKHGIIGEELGEKTPEAEFVWMLDPIDGTKTFAAGCPLFGTLICLLHNDQPILGAIHQPILNQLCIGYKEKTTLNGRRVRFRDTPQLRDATLLTTDLQSVYTHQRGEKFEKLLGSVKMFRTWGDCYGYLLLATGWADIMLDPVMNPWDLVPLLPIIRGANGTITDWQGNEPRYGTSIVAANKMIHGRVIELLNL